MLIEILVELEDGGLVTHAVAVVRRTPHCNEVLLVEPELIAIMSELMGTANQLESIDVVEVRCHLVAEKPTGTTTVHRPSTNIILE